MKKTTIFLTVILMLFLMQCTGVLAADKNEDVISSSQTVYTLRKVNLRRKPSSSAKSTATVRKGSKVILISEKKKGWSEVLYKNKVRYVRSEYLTDEKVYLTNKKTGRIIINPEENDYEIILVNKSRELSSGYKPKLKEIFDMDTMMEKEAAEAYEKMFAAARKDGAYLDPLSGYRSYEKQKSLFEKRVKEYMRSKGADRQKAEKKVSMTTMPPGTSEHNTGLAMDICEIRYEFVYTYEYRWLVKNAHKYGFILRYPEDKTDITGISYEPWHWRYVGEKHAKKIKKSGLCLEEYVEKENIDC